MAWAMANPGIISLTISIVTAGALAFYLVVVPPGTVPYP